MKQVGQALSLITALSLLLVPSLGWTAEIECEGKVTTVKAVTADVRTATTDFGGSDGQFDPDPLLETQIETKNGCLLAQFSAQADPLDNHIVFQVSVDDVPMAGHAIFPYLASAPATPVVWDPKESATLSLSRMVAYNFVAPVTRGVHTVRVRFAGCCSTTPSSSNLVRAAVLTLQYQ